MVTGHPTGMRGSGKRPPQSIDFDYLGGLSDRADREIRAAEDALIEYIAQEERREALYASTTSGLEDKFPALKKEGVR